MKEQTSFFFLIYIKLNCSGYIGKNRMFSFKLIKVYWLYNEDIKYLNIDPLHWFPRGTEMEDKTMSRLFICIKNIIVLSSSSILLGFECKGSIYIGRKGLHIWNIFFFSTSITVLFEARASMIKSRAPENREANSFTRYYV